VLESASVHLERVVVDVPTWSTHHQAGDEVSGMLQPHTYTVAVFDLKFRNPMVLERRSDAALNSELWKVLGSRAFLDGHGLLRLQCEHTLFESFPYLNSRNRHVGSSKDLLTASSREAALDATAPLYLYLVPLTQNVDTSHVPKELENVPTAQHAVYDLLRAMYSGSPEDSQTIVDVQTGHPVQMLRSLKAALVLRYTHPPAHRVTGSNDSPAAVRRAMRMQSAHVTVNVLPEEAISSCSLQVLPPEEQTLSPPATLQPFEVYQQRKQQEARNTNKAASSPTSKNMSVQEIASVLRSLDPSSFLHADDSAETDRTRAWGRNPERAVISFNARNAATPCFHSAFCRFGSLVMEANSSHPKRKPLVEANSITDASLHMSLDKKRLGRNAVHASLSRASTLLQSRGLLPNEGDAVDLEGVLQNPSADDPNAELLRAIAEVKCHYNPDEDAAFLETSSSLTDRLRGSLGDGTASIIDKSLAPLAEMFTNVFNGVMGGMMATILGTQAVTGASQSIVSDISRILPNHIRTKVPIMVAEVVRDQLPRHIAKATAERVTWILTHRMTKHMMSEVIPQVSEATARRVTLRVPKKVARIVTRRLSHMLIRSLTHSIVPALTQTLERSPLRESWCEACREHNKLCEYCWQTATQLHAGFYYAGFYSTYYSDYYTRYFDHHMAYLESEARATEVEYEKIKDLFTVTRETK